MVMMALVLRWATIMVPRWKLFDQDANNQSKSCGRIAVDPTIALLVIGRLQ